MVEEARCLFEDADRETKEREIALAVLGMVELTCRTCELVTANSNCEVHFVDDPSSREHGKALTEPRHNASDFLESSYSCPRCSDGLWRAVASRRGEPRR